MSDMGLLDAQASGGIDGANAYMQAQQELARRKKMAADQALAEAQGRGAPQVAVDQSVAAAGAPYESADRNMIQQSADYTADMGRRQGRWNEYAHNVESARTLVGSQAQGRASVVDADTKAKLALMEAQARASSRASGGGGRGGGGGGGGDTKKPPKPTASELRDALSGQAAENLRGKARQAEDDYSEARRFANQSRNSRDLQKAPKPKVNADRAELDRRILEQVTLPAAAQRTPEWMAQEGPRARDGRAMPLPTSAPKPRPARDGRVFDSGPQLPRGASQPRPGRDGRVFDSTPSFSSRQGAVASQDGGSESLRNQAIRALIANRVGGNAGPRDEAEVRAEYDGDMEAAAGIPQWEAARKAYMDQIGRSLRDSGMLRDETVARSLYSGDEVRNEMGRVAESRLAELAALGVDEYDINAALQESMKFAEGESVAQFDNRVSGADSAREAYEQDRKAAAEEAKAASKAAAEQWSMDNGVDIESMASKAMIPVDRAQAYYLTPEFQDAVRLLDEANNGYVDEDTYKADLRGIRMSLPANSRSLFNAYVDWVTG